MMTHTYKLGDLNIDILPVKDRPLSAEILRKVTFEFPMVVKYGLIHYCNFRPNDRTFRIGILLYSSPYPDRRMEDPVGNINLIINKFGHVTSCEVSEGLSGAYRYSL